ncbi:MAG: DUF6502 family protein [Pseudomonadota bacterium]
MTTGSDRLPQVLRGLLRPLVRTLIARGITAPAFYRLLKSVYVEVAAESFRLDDKPPTDSRITLLTGVHRRDVRAILSDVDDSWETARAKTAAFATVLARWRSVPDYLQADGSPQDLPRNGADGIDFESLVSSVSRDIRPRTVLDELLRQGLVEETSKGLLRMTEAARGGPTSDDHRLVFFAANVGDHLAAAAENLLSEKPPFLERAVFYNRLTPAALDEIEARARDLSQGVLEDLNTHSAAAQAAGRLEPDAHDRYRFGVYFYRERVEGAASPDDEDAKT